MVEERERNSVVPVAFVAPIRSCLRTIYERNETPTLNAILQELRMELGTQNAYDLAWSWSKSTLYRFMICNGFEHRKKSFSEFVAEQQSVILQRNKFISRIREYRAENRPIFYQDETWVNQCMTPINGYWYNDLGEGGYDIKSGLGNRAIVAHVGSSSCGLVDNGLLLFEGSKSSKSSDYHSEMNAHVFLHWMDMKILPKLPKGSVLVIDRASYHLTFDDTWYPPRSDMNKNQLIKYAYQRGFNFKYTDLAAAYPVHEVDHLIDVSDADIEKCRLDLDRKGIRKSDLFQFCKMMKKHIRYKIETLAEKYQVLILILPVHHPELNAMEHCWARMKTFVRNHNCTFTMKTVKSLTIQALSMVTKEDWVQLERKVIETENVLLELNTE